MERKKISNFYLYIILFIILMIIITFSINIFKNKPKNSNYIAKKSNYSEKSNELNNNITINDKSNKKQEEPIKEIKLSSFSTKIYNKENARQKNMEITASKLNGYIIKNGEIFSFCNILGPSTSNKGYQKADIFDKDGKKKKGLGGGNCQVSTTLYNAVLKTNNLEIIERHKHSNDVPYIKKGNDAAVAYGSYDFKFKNNTRKKY